jgi:hypothetical protein
MLISSRIKDLISEKNLSISAFELEINAGNSSVLRIIQRDSNVSGNILTKILNRYSEISPEWLILGKGSMYKESGDISNSSQSNRPIEEYKKQCAKCIENCTLLDQLRDHIETQKDLIRMYKEKLDQHSFPQDRSR